MQTQRRASVLILAGSPATPALSSIAGHVSLSLILAACLRVTRFGTPSSSIRIVVSETTLAALQHFQQHKDLLQGAGLTEANLISNGVSQASEWQGDVADLQTGIRTMGGAHVLVLSANHLSFAPGYSLQRMVEHGMTRDKDCVGISELGPLEIILQPETTGQVVVHMHDDPSLAPVVASLVSCEYADEGDWVASSLLWLTPKTLASPLLQQSKAKDLVGLAQELFSAGVNLHVLALAPGTLQLTSPAQQQFAESFVEHVDSILATEGAPTMDAAGFQLAHAKFLNQLVSGTGSKRPVPPSFYMTAYRRQAAEVLR